MRGQLHYSQGNRLHGSRVLLSRLIFLLHFLVYIFPFFRSGFTSKSIFGFHLLSLKPHFSKSFQFFTNKNEEVCIDMSSIFHSFWSFSHFLLHHLWSGELFSKFAVFWSANFHLFYTVLDACNYGWIQYSADDCFFIGVLLQQLGQSNGNLLDSIHNFPIFYMKS